MTETQRHVVDAFSEMIDEMRYGKITVNELCKRAGVSRNAFYANFDDKEDVVTFIFKRDITQPIQDLNRLLTNSDLDPMMELINERMYERLAGNGDFYRSLVGPMRGRDDTFLRVVTHVIYDMNMELLPSVSTMKDSLKIDYVAYFFASSQAMLMQKWVSDDFPLTPHDLAELYSSMTASFWRSIRQ